MESIGIKASLDYRVSGIDDIKRYNDEMKISEESQRRLRDLGKWDEANREVQHYQELEKALKSYNQAQLQSQGSGFSSLAKNAYDVQQSLISSQMKQFSLGNMSGGSMAASNQQLQRQHEIARLTARIDDLIDELDDLNDKYESAKQSDDTRGMLNLSTTRQNTEQEKTSLEDKLKKLLAENGGGTLGKYFGMKEFQQIVGYGVQGAQIGSNYRMDIANGNYIGAGINAGKAVGDTVGGAAMSAGAIMMLIPGLQIPGAIAAGAGGLTKGITDVVASYKQAGDTEANAYEKSIAKTNSLNRLYTSGLADSADTDRLLQTANEKAIGTNLGVYDFLDNTKNITKYGVSQQAAFNYTRQAALMANNTGSDIGTMQALLGTSSRYGMGSVSNDYLTKARNAAGLDKAQTQEFLNSMLNVVEEGISNGYVNSVEQVAQNMTMFAQLSGGSALWTGEQGAKRIAQIQSGISGSVAMNDVGDLIVTNAAKNLLGSMSEKEQRDLLGYTDKNKTQSRRTGTYIDEMLLMENGKDPRLFNEIIKTIQDMEGDNSAAQIERFKDVFQLNYSGAIDVYNMTQNGTLTPNQITSSIQKMQADENYTSDETKKMQIINKLDTSVALMGKNEFWENIEKLDKMSEDKQKEYDQKTNPPKQTYGYASNVTPGTEVAAVDQVIKDNALQQMTNRGGLPNGYGGITFGNIMNKSYMAYNQRTGKSERKGGNDELDELFKVKVAQYGAIDNGKLDLMELKAALVAHDSKEMQDAYNSGNKDVYLAALEAMLTRLFGKITLQEN